MTAKNHTHNWTLRERLLFYTDRREEGCWPWTGEKNVGGYGIISVRGKRQLAHRVSFSLHVGPITNGMHVCHHCDNPCCVRPDHLFMGTRTDNMRDMVSKGRHAVRRGVDNPASKLNPEAVQEIRALSRAEGAKQTVSSLARKYGVSRRAIRFVISGESWRGV